VRRFFHAAALIGVGAAIGFGAVVVNAGASPTPPSTRTMLNVVGNAIGQPLPVRIAGSGFAPGGLVYVEQCDGTLPTAVGWSPTSNCDLGSSPAAVLADANGNAVYQPDDVNHGFTPFKGESPQSLFNCLSPNQAAVNAKNGLPDFRNCQVRVSSDNTNPTADQQFFDLTLPDAVWEAPFAHSTGSCSGQRVLGTWHPTPLSNVATTGEYVSTALLKNRSTLVPFGGTCTGTSVGTLTPKAFAMKVLGTSSCTATSAGAPISGKLTITMNEIDPISLLHYQIQAFVRRTPGVDPTAADISLYQGTIIKGVGVGSTIVGTLFEDPIVKAPKGVSSVTGYVDAHTLLTQCKAGSATISTVEIGAGTSMFGGIASGLHFGY
jgi:hypothetical protein